MSPHDQSFMVEINPSKYRTALDIITVHQASLSDDTYVEKLVTETSKRIATNPDLFDTWGISSFVTSSLESTSAPLNNLALSFLYQCFPHGQEIFLQSKKTVENFLKEENVKPTTNMLMLLTAMVKSQGAQWSRKEKVWKVVEHCWNGQSGESIFWRKELAKLTIQYLIWNLESDDNVLQHLTGVFLSLKDCHITMLKSVLPPVLKHVYSMKNVSPETKELLQILENPLDDEDLLESRLWYLKIISEEKFRCEIKALVEHMNEKDARLQLKALASAMFGSEEDSILGLFIEKLRIETPLLSSAILKHLTLLFSEVSSLVPRLFSALERFLRNINDDSLQDLTMSEPQKLLEVCISSYETLVNKSFFDEIISQRELLANLCARNDISDLLKVRIIQITTKLVENSSLTMSEAMEKFWLLSVGGHWGVADAVLVLLATTIEKCQMDSNFKDSGVDKAKNIARISLESKNSYVRASAMSILTRMISHIEFDVGKEPNCKFEPLIKKFLLDETEALVKRKTAKFAKRFLQGNWDDFSETKRYLMIQAVSDFDCETRETVFDIWKEYLDLLISKIEPEMTLEAVLDLMRERGMMAVIAIACQDGETSFKSHARSTVLKMKNFLIKFGSFDDTSCPTLKKKRKIEDNVDYGIDDETKDDEIDWIVKASDVTLLGKVGKDSVIPRENPYVMPKYSNDEFLELLNGGDFEQKGLIEEQCELLMGLDSVLTDIIQSVTDENKIDGIDCV